MSEALSNVIKELSMEGIAKGNLPTQDNANQIKAQLNMFVLAQAQRELKKVIRITETLDLIQDTYESALTSYVQDVGDAELIDMLPKAIETLTKALEVSNNIITKVLGNEKIMNFQILSADNNSTINIGNTQNVSEVVDLHDSNSRKKVRETVSAIMKYIEEQKDDGDVSDLQT